MRGVFERLRKTNEFPAEHSALASAQAQGRRDKNPNTDVITGEKTEQRRDA